MLGIDGVLRHLSAWCRWCVDLGRRYGLAGGGAVQPLAVLLPLPDEGGGGAVQPAVLLAGCV
jgi:hypothetical protein